MRRVTVLTPNGISNALELRVLNDRRRLARAEEEFLMLIGEL
jgi:hypothetical protein